MADATRPDSTEDCLVLLEELIRANRNLAAENEKLRQDHEKASKNQAEILHRGSSRGCMTENMFLPEDGIALTHDVGEQEIQLPFLRPAG